MTALVAFACALVAAGVQGPTAGVAAGYPGDRGIGADARVLLAEDFEGGTLADLGERWSDVSNKGGSVLQFSGLVPPRSPGKRSLCVTAVVGENEGGHLYTRLPRGVDRAYLRFYVRFAEDAGYIHHFVTLGGYNPSTAWPQGGAGDRPEGDDRATAGIEPTGNGGAVAAPGAWNFYAYWPEMKVSAGGRFWGNGVQPARPLVVPRGRWQCVEVMMNMNSHPDRSDGELALWLDGKPAMHLKPGTPRSEWTGMGFKALESGGTPFEGFRWRTDATLKINFVWLMHYVTENAARANRVPVTTSPNPVWFDHVVVSTEYIGPIQ